MDRFVFYAALCGGMFVCLQGLGQLVVKNKRQFNYLLAATNLCGGILLLHFCWELSEETYDIVRFSDVYEPSVNFMLAVLAYFTFRQLIEARFTITSKQLIHFSPAGLSFLILAVLYLVKISRHNPESSFHDAHLVINYAFYIVSSIWIFAYSLINFIISHSLLVQGKSKYPEAKFATLALLIAVIVISASMVFASISMSFVLYKIVCLLAIALFLVIYFLIQRYPTYVLNIKKAYSRARYEQSKISGLDIDSVIGRLNDIMEVEKEYENEDLSLGMLSEMLNITSHQLSQILNDKMKRSFPRFINKFRLDAAKTLLATDKSQSILSIAFHVGFKSKSAFYTSFRKEFNMTPTEFRNL